MEFNLTLVLLGLPAALLRGLIVTPLFRSKSRESKALAILLAPILTVVFAWAFFMLLLIWSTRAGHPF